MTIERRTVLRGLLGGSAVGVGLPVLECMLTTNGDALASGELLPVRFGLFFWGNGVIPDPVSYTHLTLPTICSV